MIKSNPSGHAQISRERHRFFKWRDAIDRSIHPAADKHLTAAVESNSGWILYVAGKLSKFSVHINAKNRHRKLFTART